MDSQQIKSKDKNASSLLLGGAGTMTASVPIPTISAPPRIFRSTQNRHSNSLTAADAAAASAENAETSSEVHSVMSSDGNYELIEYDFPEETSNVHVNGNVNVDALDVIEVNNERTRTQTRTPGDSHHDHEDSDDDYDDDDDVFDEGPDADLFQEVGAVSIQKDSPAAAALRANAEIQVSSLGKAARAVHMQSVRRALKRAAGKGRSNRTKGKPPRVPFGVTAQLHMDEFADVDNHDHDGYQSVYDDEEEEGAATTASASTQSDRKAHLSAITGTCDLAVHPELDEEDNQEDEDQHDHQQSSTDDNDLDELSIEQEQQHHPLPPAPRTPEHPADMGNHIPDGVVPGTAEAGKKGTLNRYFAFSRHRACDLRLTTLYFFVHLSLWHSTYCFHQSWGLWILTTCSNSFDGVGKRKVHWPKLCKSPTSKERSLMDSMNFTHSALPS